jgi:hypothetical protein
MRSRLELSIERYQLHDRLIMQQCDRPHFLEMYFQLSGRDYDEDGVVDTGQSRFYGGGLARGGQWQQCHQQPIMTVNIHLEPELVADFWGEDCKDINVSWQKLFRSDEQLYFVYSGSITSAMQIALQQIINCPYQGKIPRMYLESKVWELMALQLAQMSEDSNKPQEDLLKLSDRDRLDEARNILRDRKTNKLLII